MEFDGRGQGRGLRPTLPPAVGGPVGDHSRFRDLHGAPDPHSNAKAAWPRRLKWAVLGSNQ